MANSQLSTRPIYLQLRDAFAARIASGLWKPGKSIPNETDLACEFGVSLGTTRKALSVMETERLITREQGRGTFVIDPAARELADRYGGAESEIIVGRFGAAEIEEVVASEAECRRLQLRGGDPVWRIRRARSGLDRAFMWEEVSLPAEMFPGLRNRNCASIVLLAQVYGLLLGAAQERISIGPATWAAAEALGIARGAPVMVLDRVVGTICGQPVEWRMGWRRLAADYYLAHIN